MQGYDDKPKPDGDKAGADPEQGAGDFRQPIKGDSPGRTGRPTILDDELIERFCDAIRTCYFLSVAADLLEIDESMAYRWLRQGKAEAARQRKGLPPKSPNAAVLIRFLRAINKTNAQEEVKLLKLIDEAGPGWQARAWKLERRIPERYALRDRKKLAELEEMLKDLERNTQRNPRKPKDDDPS